MLTTFLLTVIGYLRALAEIVVVGFVVAGVINAVVNKEVVARYLGGSPVVANLLGATIGIVTPHRPGALSGRQSAGTSMLHELGLWIVLGVLLGAAIEAFVPDHLFTQYVAGASLVGLLAALVVAGIFSADSLGSLPWVQSPLTKGLGAGSAMILLVAGVGTNVSTLGPVGQVMGRRTAI